MRHAFVIAGVGAVLVRAAPALTRDLTITQKNKAFSEREVKIAIGDSLTFTNADDFTHNVYSATKGMEFDLRTQPPGKSSTVKFEKAGTLTVECAIHPKMRLSLHVGG